MIPGNILGATRSLAETLEACKGFSMVSFRAILTSMTALMWCNYLREPMRCLAMCKDCLLAELTSCLKINRSCCIFSSNRVGAERVREAVCVDELMLYIAFSPQLPKAKEYARILSEGMNELRASGELQAILSQYGLTDWRKTP